MQTALGEIGIAVHDGTPSPGPLRHHEIAYRAGVPSFGAPMEHDASDLDPGIAYITTYPVKVHTASGNPGPPYERQAAN